MSFSNEVKNEMIEVNQKNRGLMLSELCGIFYGNARIQLRNSLPFVSFYTESSGLCKRMDRFFRHIYKDKNKICILDATRFTRMENYRLEINEEVSQKFLKDIGVKLDLFDIEYVHQPKLFNGKEKECAFLRGTFLGAGSISDPKRRYHLDIIQNKKDHLIFIQKIMEKYKMHPKISNIKGAFRLYLKESDDIITFLTLTKAHNAVLYVEDQRAFKQIRNTLNRQNNCEVSNLEKSVEASTRQRIAIEKIQRKMGLEKLDQSLREIALLRLSNPQSSMKDLAEKCNPPLTKSGASYRMQQLIKIANEIKVME